MGRLINDCKSKLDGHIHCVTPVLMSVFPLHEVLTEERVDLANTVGPCLGVSARRGPTPGGGIRVDPFPDVPDWPVAVERMVRFRIDLYLYRIPSALGGFGQLPAGFRKKFDQYESCTHKFAFAEDCQRSSRQP
jgi:hypothetical protein